MRNKLRPRIIKSVIEKNLKESNFISENFMNIFESNVKGTIKIFN